MAGYGLVCYDNAETELDDAAKLLSIVLGYEMTQAYSCVMLIQQREQYLVRRYKASEKKEAEMAVQTLTINGIPSELIRL